MKQFYVNKLAIESDEESDPPVEIYRYFSWKRLILIMHEYRISEKGDIIEENIIYLSYHLNTFTVKDGIVNIAEENFKCLPRQLQSDLELNFAVKEGK